MESSLVEENKPSLENLFDDFSHPNPNINKNACLSMIQYWPQDSLERLLLHLSDKDIVLRRKSLNALALFGEMAISPLVRMFTASDDVNIRTSCLKVFVKIAAMEQCNSLPQKLSEVITLSLKDDNPQMILVLVSLLRQIGKPALPLLIKMSRDTNILRAKASVTAIGEIDHPSARDCLKELSESNSIDILIRESANYSLEISSNMND